MLAASRPGTDGGQQAFAQLYRDYWAPLYAYVRRRGFARAEAEDIAQNFFIRLLEKHALSALEREGGRFRSFLLSCLENYLANEWDRVHARKRGGGQPLLSLNAEEGEAGFVQEQADQQTPESLFEKRWVFTLLEHVTARLRTEYAADGKEKWFDQLKVYLQGDRVAAPYASVAAQLSTSEGALKVAVHRMRHQYGQLLREEIARTVSSPQEVDAELRHLISVVGK